MPSDSTPVRDRIHLNHGPSFWGVLQIEHHESTPEATQDVLAAASQLAQVSGISRDQLEERIGSKSRHEFTLRVDGDHIQGVSYEVGREWLRFYYIFRNGRLTSIVEPPEFEYHDVPYRGDDPLYKGTRRSVQSPWTPKKRVREVLAAPGLDENGIVRSLDRRLPEESDNLQPLLPIGILGAVLHSPKESLNHRLKLNIDPFQVEVGDEPAHVKEALGSPIDMCRPNNEKLVCIYGTTEELESIPEERRFSNIRVVFGPAGAEAVFSYDFFKPCNKSGQ